LIFCDIDGVLNDSPRGAYRLLPELVGRVDALAREANARLVVSSWWRWMGVPTLRRDLAAAGFTGKVIGRTPWLGDTDAWDARERGIEIQAVLDYLGDSVEGIVILDDHDRMGRLLPWLVQTDGMTGITDDDLATAMDVLHAQAPGNKKVTKTVDKLTQDPVSFAVPPVGGRSAADGRARRNQER
jgi:hypothetical protein